MRRFPAALSMIMLSLQAAAACTVISYSNGGRHLAGRNWDYRDTSAAIQYAPAGRKSNAMILFRCKSYVTEGMNSHGLCMAFTGVPNVPRRIMVSPFKRWSISVYLIRDVLARCATVDEAVAFIPRFMTT